MLKHTPGPWVVDSGMVQAGKGIPIAWMDREPGNGTMPVERDQNARLIAAAPEMLALLQRIGGSLHIEQARDDARALLAKIEGGE